MFKNDAAMEIKEGEIPLILLANTVPITAKPLSYAAWRSFHQLERSRDKS